MTDRGFFHLLTHLSRGTTTLPLPTIQASIAHYLAHVQPSPTPLTGTVVGSPYFRPISYPKLEALQTAFRHAVHFKVKLFKDEDDKGGVRVKVFQRGVAARTGQWITEILLGLQGGEQLLRLACTGGLLLGIADWEHEVRLGNSRAKRETEDELLMALAEVMDLFASSPSGWEREFKTDAQDLLAGALLVTARVLPMVASERLAVLPLASLTRLLSKCIASAFHSGTFLASLPDSIKRSQDGKVQIQPKSRFEEEMRELAASTVLQSMPSLSAMFVQVVAALADSRPSDAWPVMHETMRGLILLTARVEADWLRSPLSSVPEDNSIASESQEVVTTMWTVLKTLLFTTIRLIQSVLSVVVFVPQPSPSVASAASPTAYGLALEALHTFSHLAFVLPQFGGVASTAESSFPELRKVFYTALDVLSSDSAESSRFVHELHGSFLTRDGMQASPEEWPTHFLAAKKAYALACMEQLVPVLGEITIRYDVYPLCAPHLNDPSHRETYESAHSVVLAILVAHALKANTAPRDPGQVPFAEEFIPAYVQCLLDNAADGRLNTQQLCLAFRALVQSAGAFGSSVPVSVDMDSTSEFRTATAAEGDAFAWYCVETLVQRLHALSVSNEDHKQRLRLALVAAVPAVSLGLLPRLLEAVRVCVEEAGSTVRRHELVEALFQEIAQRVGDEAKELAMRWWHENKEALQMHTVDDIPRVDAEEVKGKGKARELIARL